MIVAKDKVIPFDLRVALMLANQNLKRAKRHQNGAALLNLGVCRRVIGDRRVDLTFLQSAEKHCGRR